MKLSYENSLKLRQRYNEARPPWLCWFEIHSKNLLDGFIIIKCYRIEWTLKYMYNFNYIILIIVQLHSIKKKILPKSYPSCNNNFLSCNTYFCNLSSSHQTRLHKYRTKGFLVNLIDENSLLWTNCFAKRITRLPPSSSYFLDPFNDLKEEEQKLPYIHKRRLKNVCFLEVKQNSLCPVLPVIM